RSSRCVAGTSKTSSTSAQAALYSTTRMASQASSCVWLVIPPSAGAVRTSLRTGAAPARGTTLPGSFSPRSGKRKMTSARAFWIVGERRGEIREERLRPVAEGEVLVEAMYGAVSRGTELLVFEGCVPESERERMRAPFQDGRFPHPV